MKKLLSLILICSLLLIGCSNSNTIPKGFTEDEYNLTLKVVETLDNYLSAEIDADTAKEKLELLGSQLEDSSDTTVSLIGTYASSSTLDISNADYDELRKNRDKIKKYLNE